ncbi:MAG: acyltransferase family protein [Alphaproteobacteria bacterium]
MEFLFGCCIFVIYDKYPNAFRFGKPVLFLACGSLLVQNFYPLDLPRPLAWGLPSALLVFGSLGLTLPTNRLAAFFGRMGDASYSLYLVHPYILGIVFRIIVPILGPSVISISLAALASLAGAIIASFILFKIIERPMNDLARQWFLPKTPPPLPAR